MTMTRRAAVGLVAMLATFRGKRSAGGVPLAVDGQPMPRDTLVGWSDVGWTKVTAITRIWNPGDEKTCRRCPDCFARSGVCTIQVREYIAKSDAPDYRWPEEQRAAYLLSRKSPGKAL